MAYVIQSTYILLAPTLMAASIYMMLGRIIRLTNGEAHSFISSSKITKIFVTGDVICLLAQSGGKQKQGRQNENNDCYMFSVDNDHRRRSLRRRSIHRDENRNRRPSPANPRIPRLCHDSGILQRRHQQGPDNQISGHNDRLAPAFACHLHQLGSDLPSVGCPTCRVCGRIFRIYLHARVVSVPA